MVLVGLAACGDPQLPVRGTEHGPTLLAAGCDADESCPAGMVCEGCNGPHDAACVPGCRTDAQCPRLHVCRGPVTCSTCPCAPGWCELDPCRDVDGDGFTFTDAPDIECPGKQKGDCNDGNAQQHPGAQELCANFVDDDCDGKTDRNDASCQQCTEQSQRCNDASDCLAGGQLGNARCERGCCLSCPTSSPLSCGANETSVGGGLDPVTACRVQRVCVDWRTCQNLPFDQVCGVDFASYRNPCQAQQVGVALLHSGACRWNEGRPCATTAVGGSEGCESGQYCRLDATAGKRCTLVGTCVTEADCPAGLGAPSPCDGGTSWACEQRRCVGRCH